MTKRWRMFIILMLALVITTYCASNSSPTQPISYLINFSGSVSLISQNNTAFISAILDVRDENGEPMHDIEVVMHVNDIAVTCDELVNGYVCSVSTPMTDPNMNFEVYFIALDCIPEAISLNGPDYIQDFDLICLVPASPMPTTVP